MLAPDRVIVFPPMGATTLAPVQVSVGFAGAGGVLAVPTMTRPAGSVSLTLIPVIAISVGAVTVILSRLGTPGRMGLVWKALLTRTGPPGLLTVRLVGVVVVAVFPIP